MSCSAVSCWRKLNAPLLVAFASLFAVTAASEPESVHYIEVKSIEPLAVEKATDLATNFFKEKYPNRCKNYVPKDGWLKKKA